MAFCNNCGAYVADGFDQCPACGKSTRTNKKIHKDAWDIYEDNGMKGGASNKTQNSATDSAYNKSSYKDSKQKKPDSAKAAKDEFRANEWNQPRNDSSTVYTGEIVYDAVPTGKRILALCSYLEALVLIPLLVDKEDSFVRFHINQGLALFLLSIIRWVLAGMFFLGIFAALLNVLIGVLAIMGAINALQGKQKELPIIGTIKILK